jgi:hypothetical protein
MGMDQRQRRREGSQRAQASRARRLNARSKRRNRNVLYALGGAVGLAIVIVLVVLLQGSGPDLGIRVSTLGGIHGPPFVYNTDIAIEGQRVTIPPTSGNHNPVQSPYGFQGQPLIPEAVVHNMEHGSAVIWYQPDDPVLAGQINQLVRQLGSSCLVAGSYRAMDFKVAVTVWGRVLPLDQFDETQMRDFLRAYRGNEGPEADVCRSQS